MHRRPTTFRPPTANVRGAGDVAPAELVPAAEPTSDVTSDKLSKYRGCPKRPRNAGGTDLARRCMAPATVAAKPQLTL
eukprot:CAMPEP_0170603244 /NCGR_PEP_ID=MMETSP0224-20130122/18810_1 /TAXON_ID=285029 /ORGANISM="Togula jolla, Strain CCCM 725" /LENGTH=77 /DNA_ID=CAMNT_0010928115 /DNA_START=560 /DNA_END=793 /DNA_ORIENTATION=-